MGSADRDSRSVGRARAALTAIVSILILMWPALLNGHEFHYSSARQSRLPPLFTATDARGDPMPPMGAVIGRVMGSYAHVVDRG